MTYRNPLESQDISMRLIRGISMRIIRPSRSWVNWRTETHWTRTTKSLKSWVNWRTRTHCNRNTKSINPWVNRLPLTLEGQEEKYCFLCRTRSLQSTAEPEMYKKIYSTAFKAYTNNNLKWEENIARIKVYVFVYSVFYDEDQRSRSVSKWYGSRTVLQTSGSVKNRSTWIK